MLAGVSGGLGKRFDLNPWWFRGGFLFLALFGGAGVALYVVAWLLMPEEQEEDSVAAGWLSRLDIDNPATVGGVVLIGVAAVILISGTNIVPGRYVVAALLLVVGVLLYRGDLGGRSPTAADEEAAPGTDPAEPDAGTKDPATEPAAAAPSDAVEDGPGEGEADLEALLVASLPPPETETADSSLPPSEPYAGPTDVAEPQPPRPKSVLGRVTMASLLIGLGALAAIDVAGWASPDLVHYLAVALTVIGAGLVAGAVFGRARWLIAVGLLLIPPILVASVVSGFQFTGTVGERYLTPTAAEVDGRYHLAAGSLTLDLGGIDLASQQEIAVDAEVGAGELVVIVPQEVGLAIDASVGIGSLDLFGRERAGIGIRDRIDDPGRGTLVIEARTGFGTVTIVRSTWEGTS